MTNRWQSSARVVVGVVSLLGISCAESKSTPPVVAAYLGTDVCSGHVDATSCSADSANGCAWASVALDCAPGASCPTGFCHAASPCEQHSDATSCSADTTNGCAWAAVDTSLAYCPSGNCATSTSGFCYAPSNQTGGGCACACPLYCPQGAACPPCDCACPPPTGGGSTGGGTCTCACAACAPGETCAPCDCACAPPDSGGGSTCGGTCTCACPVCPVGTTCPACDCACDGGSAPTPPDAGIATCTCPTCTGTDPCPACDCPPPTVVDPCSAYADATACRNDTANQCTWIALGVPCQVGEPCISGVCQQVVVLDGGAAGGGCVCGCPACAPGETCPPCGCDCTGGTGAGGCP